MQSLSLYSGGGPSTMVSLSLPVLSFPPLLLLSNESTNHSLQKHMAHSWYYEDNT